MSCADTMFFSLTLMFSVTILTVTNINPISAAQITIQSAGLHPSAYRDERNIDIESINKDLQDESKFISVYKRKHSEQNRMKHPFILTKEDIEEQDNIVDDSIIVESNVLKLIRPGKKDENEISRIKREDPSVHNRVKRGWNLQHVIVPNKYPYVAIKDSTRWNSVRRSKEWYEEPVKTYRQQAYKGWGSSAQELQPRWPVKMYG